MKNDLPIRPVVARSAETFEFCAQFLELFNPREHGRRRPKLYSRCPECSRRFQRKQPLTSKQRQEKGLQTLFAALAA
jgi:hypothetical protein